MTRGAHEPPLWEGPRTEGSSRGGGLFWQFVENERVASLVTEPGMTTAHLGFYLEGTKRLRDATHVGVSPRCEDESTPGGRELQSATPRL